MNNITVVGAGYVGLANSFLIGISQKVTLIDIDNDKIAKLINGKSPISDQYINDYIDKVQVEYTTDKAHAYTGAELVFVATDTSYDEDLNQFNLKSVEGALADIAKYASPGTVIVIKSTVPIGFTDEMQVIYPQYKLIFSPEFLREGFALYDNLYPDRIVVGGKKKYPKEASKIAEILKQNVLSEDTPIVITSNNEAEVVKLFANTYLAMRVSFVNELDTFCQKNGMATENVLDAIGYDKRIGREYWNPSFGYGGYCLPKDTKQLKSEYTKQAVPQNLIANIVNSNETRKRFIADQIIAKVGGDKTKTVGIYRIIAKKGINNFRSSAVVDIAHMLINDSYQVIIYEPYAETDVLGMKVVNDFEQFSTSAAVIVANRLEPQIKNNDKVYTVDVYNQY